MSRKRKTNYPVANNKKKGPAPVFTPQVTPPTVAKINLQATQGSADIRVGMTVTILGGGLYAGETAVVEALTAGVIPSATVRTAAGNTRRIRTVDLAPASRTSERPDAD